MSDKNFDIVGYPSQPTPNPSKEGNKTQVPVVPCGAPLLGGVRGGFFPARSKNLPCTRDRHWVGLQQPEGFLFLKELNIHGVGSPVRPLFALQQISASETTHRDPILRRMQNRAPLGFVNFFRPLGASLLEQLVPSCSNLFSLAVGLMVGQKPETSYIGAILLPISPFAYHQVT